ncbi:fumarylacetoacetate hydrolase family protein [Agarilytica rhodophyticola]|uniref:fumarylacetoacetate hydrolase family protein n=1 Tax=Agarilytica rhodophyticola TaxID=1737490 RepID=UPI000CD9CDA1|nr:fumarylacetoacetate hydrolase family protein [Agarilytica rhodophyticola]
MKLATFIYNDVETWGINVNGKLIDIPSCERELGVKLPFDNVLSMVKYGKNGIKLVDELVSKVDFSISKYLVIEPDEVVFLAPIQVPESIRDFGLFEKHLINIIRFFVLGKFSAFDKKLEKLTNGKFSLAKKINKNWYHSPSYYKGNRFAMIGHNAHVKIPSGCRAFDFELELGVYLCSEAANITKENAKNHIFGVTLFNDFTARDIQGREMGTRMGPAKGKDFDRGYSTGPYLVTTDELDIDDIECQVYVNGKLFGGGNTDEMHWSFEEVIEYTSKNETLYPGELIGSGTITGKIGSGCGAEIGQFLKPGDTVELKNSVIGTLKNIVD